MSRKIFREFAKSKGKEAKEFVELQSEMYQHDTLITKSTSGALEKTSINYKNMLFWVFRNFKLIAKNQ